jgi:hypothetical protein
VKATRDVSSRTITVTELPVMFKDPSDGTTLRNSLDEITIVLNYRGVTNVNGRALVLDNLLIPLILDAINATQTQTKGD